MTEQELKEAEFSVITDLLFEVRRLQAGEKFTVLPRDQLRAIMAAIIFSQRASRTWADVAESIEDVDELLEEVARPFSNDF